MTTGRTRELAFKSVLLGAVGVLGLALGEIALRWVRPDLGWRPHTDVDLGWSTLEYQRIDPAGAPASGERWLFLGDSYLAGAGVGSLRERFPELLERRLGNQVSVEIMASGGWGPDQELLAYMQKGRRWLPTVVVIAFCATNDTANNLSNGYGPGMWKPYFTSEGGELRLFDARGEPLEAAAVPAQRPPSLPRSFLVDFARLRWHLAAEPLEPNPGAERADPRYLLFAQREEKGVSEIYELRPELSWSPQSGVNDASAFLAEDFALKSFQWELTERILERFRDEVRVTGARLVVMLLPVPFKPRDTRFVTGADFEFRFSTPEGPVTFRAAEPQKRLSNICRRLGIELFDPTAEFIARVEGDGLVEATWSDPTDRHFSRVGHEILAEQTRAYLRPGSEAARRR